MAIVSTIAVMAGLGAAAAQVSPVGQAPPDWLDTWLTPQTVVWFILLIAQVVSAREQLKDLRGRVIQAERWMAKHEEICPRGQLLAEMAGVRQDVGDLRDDLKEVNSYLRDHPHPQGS
jgi:hypothetical protein